MTALATHAQRSHAVHHLRLVAVPVLADTAIWDGALVCIDANGFGVPAADSAGLTFLGVAYRGFDNTDGANGVVSGLSSERYCEVDTNGPWSFAVGATPKAGQLAYVVDDNTTTPTAGDVTNDIVCGRYTEPDPDGSGHWFVDVERR